MHPRKRTRVVLKTKSSHIHPQTSYDTDSISDSSLSSEYTSLSSCSSSSECESQYTRTDTAMASVLVRQNNLSTHKSHDVLEADSKEGFSVPIPSQSGFGNE